GRKDELLSHPAVPVFGQRLGELHGEAMRLEVVAVRVGLEQLVRELADPGADGDDRERDDIILSGVFAPEEVGQAEPPVAPLSWEVNSLASGPGPAKAEEVAPLGPAGVVAVDDGRLQHALRLETVEPVTQPGPPVGLHKLFVRGPLAAPGTAQAPL